MNEKEINLKSNKISKWRYLQIKFHSSHVTIWNENQVYKDDISL